MNNLDYQYQQLIRRILTDGTLRADRTGTGTISVFGAQLRHNMSEGFPLLTTKKMAVKTMMTELKWFLKGDTNIKYLVDNNCKIWNGDAYKNYLAHSKNPLSMEDFIEEIKKDDLFATQWGELGPIYGAQWRHWLVKDESSYDGEYVWVDQIKNLINGLKNNPYSRRHMVSAWNVGQMEEMVLPPCHYGFQCYISNGKLSLMWNQRSVDTFLGLPFNFASYGTLLELLAIEVGAEPGELICNLGDVHLYSNHIDQAEELIQREPYQLPTIEFSNIDILKGEWDYELKDYQSHPAIKAPLSN